MAAPVDRRRVAVGGAVGTAVGAGLAVLAGFFAVAGLVRARLPWSVAVLAPLLCAALLVRAARASAARARAADAAG